METQSCSSSILHIRFLFSLAKWCLRIYPCKAEFPDTTPRAFRSDFFSQSPPKMQKGPSLHVDMKCVLQVAAPSCQSCSPQLLYRQWLSLEPTRSETEAQTECGCSSRCPEPPVRAANRRDSQPDNKNHKEEAHKNKEIYQPVVRIPLSCPPEREI